MLRLVRSQGLLQGKDLSPVQVAALSYCTMDEEYNALIQRADADFTAVKRVLLSIKPSLFAQLFPAYVPPSKRDEEQEALDQVEQDMPTPEEAAELERWMQQNAHKMTGADLDDDPDEGWM